MEVTPVQLAIISRQEKVVQWMLGKVKKESAIEMLSDKTKMSFEGDQDKVGVTADSPADSTL